MSTDTALAAEIEDVVFQRRTGGDDAAPFELRVSSLRLHAGEAVACIGPSGSGKTTLVHLLAGILTPHAGEIRLAGARIDGLHESARRARRAREIGLVFQEFELLDYLDALDNILLPIRLGRGDLVAGAARARGLAHALGIAPLLRRVSARLSQGERQRVAIARALVTSPSLVLCDEPTGNLDPESAGSVLDLLLEQAREHEAALLMVTHDHTLLGRFDRVIDVRELARPARRGEAQP
ncbi:ABC transporter ATP-binding protein YxdL [Planctomycetes bacterium Poly30]|uniref:ABC transporter ATP-binding protein YxdL n=1 Tax=Saltatorellus ferox TaxID=2528018 RepID=A0A518EWT2_9BACT|nr:ABC transporter ATP-binding protein YxdL [Planctomycetes bacterium Poly30]